MPRVTIDGDVYEAAEGRTLLQALDDLGLLMNGIDVPHYCWHPKLSIDGSCRLCQVEIEGMPKLQIACDTLVREGMVVHTQSERVKQARAGVMELLLVNHPLDCPICDQAGECKLQDYAYEYGLGHARTREPRRALKKKVDLGPTIVFDQERCILCRRCVRFTREIPGTGELAVFSRGDRSVIETFPGEELDNDYSMNVADICPVGALTTRDFRFKVRVWDLTDVPGVCTGCANGCNVNMGAARNRVYRYVPRRNDAVNDTWLCDAGRMSYKQIEAPGRLRGARLRSEDGPLRPVSLDEAVRAAAARLRGVPGDRVAALASAHATNEDLFALRRLLSVLGAETVGVPVPLGLSDDLLVKSAKAANAAGARALGFGDPAPVRDRLRRGEIEVLFVMGNDLLADEPEAATALSGASAPFVILLDRDASALERAADVVFAARHAAEKLGTLTNHAGRVQRVEPAVEPVFEAWSEGEIFQRIGQALGYAGFEAGWDPAAVSRQLSFELPAFEGVTLESVGLAGSVLQVVAGGGS